ncbi:hypothetical protein DLM78_04125 [Leptospira stimsonii]|uniref:Uncharacterized protein n=1 Tax=Leptospira stimsonii TaxID=2202203 RepID=A0A8B3CTY7_9LEPT|nr:hypothetical protein DLM78_04125 [Leptospira stimsonii]
MRLSLSSFFDYLYVQLNRRGCTGDLGIFSEKLRNKRKNRLKSMRHPILHGHPQVRSYPRILPREITFLCYRKPVCQELVKVAGISNGESIFSGFSIRFFECYFFGFLEAAFFGKDSS